MPIAIIIVIFTRKHQAHQKIILTLRVILFKWDPRPHHFTWIRIAVVVWCVIRGESATKVDGTATFGHGICHVGTLRESGSRKTVRRVTVSWHVGVSDIRHPCTR